MTPPEKSLARARIAFDARYARDSFGGIGRYAAGLLRAMVDAAPEVTFVVYFDPEHAGARYSLEGTLAAPNVVARPVRLPLYSPAEQAKLPFLLARDRASLFYSPYFSLPLAATVPLIATVHDLIFERDPAHFSGRWIRYYYRPMMRLGLRRAAAVCAVSESTRRDLASYYGLDTDRVAVVPDAVDRQFRCPLPAEEVSRVRAALGLPQRYVLVVGARRPHKNLGTAMRAFAAVQAEFPHWLVVVGRPEGRYRDEVAEVRKALGGQVRLLEKEVVSEADLPGVYAGADALLMPSFHEGFGLPALEAMACGTPVVAGDRTALPEVVGDGGVFANPGDVVAVASALRRLLSDPELRQQLCANALRRAANFTWERSAATALDAVANVVGRTGPIGR